MESMEVDTHYSSFAVKNPANESQLSFGLLSLPDDCIHQILKWLPLDDLCSMSHTCSALQRITGEYFHLKYRTKKVTISGVVESFLKAKVVWCFRPYIRNVEFVQKQIFGDKLFEIIFSNIDKCVKNILFSQCYFRKATTTDSNGGILQTLDGNILDNLETVEFHLCKAENNEYQTILQHCHRIKNLTIIEEFNGNNELLLTKFPTLQHVKFKGIKTTEIFTKNVKIFLEQNSNIKIFTWYFNSHKHQDFDFIKTILKYGNNLEELYLSFVCHWRCNLDLPSICNELQTWSQRKKIKRLELEFNSKTIDTASVASLQFLSGLHLDYELNYECYMSTINTQHNLRILNIKSVKSSRDWELISANNLINLEELIIEKLGSYAFLTQFIRHCPKLKTVKIIEFCISPVKFLFSEAAKQKLNRERSKLTGACNMTIFVKPSPRFNLPNITSDFNFRLVKVKCVNFDYNYFFHVNKGFNHWSVEDV